MVGAPKRIPVLDHEEDVALVLNIGPDRYSFKMDAIRNRKLVSSSYRIEKYDIAIDTEARVLVSTFNVTNDNNGGGNN